MLRQYRMPTLLPTPTYCAKIVGMGNVTGTPETSAKCRGCGHRIWSARSIERGYSDRCFKLRKVRAIEAAIAPFSARQQEKILTAMSSGECEPAGPGAWKVPSSRGDRKYRATTAYCPCDARVMCWHVGTVRAIEAVAMLTRTSYAKAA
jgi:hypothetical protein